MSCFSRGITERALPLCPLTKPIHMSRLMILVVYQIMAYDHGIPKRNTTTTLTVTVLDKNDNPPVIDGGAYITTNISEVSRYLIELFYGY